jgi:hypothetical protein
VTATNAGQANATGVVVLAPVPAGLAFVSDDGGGSYNPATGEWSAGSIGNGAAPTLHIVAKVTASGALNTTARRIASTPLDANPLDDQASVILSVARQADLTLAATAAPPTVSPGGTTDITLTLTNHGIDRAYNGVVATAVSGGSVQASTPSTGVFDSATGQWRIAAFAKGATATMHVSLKQDGSGSPILLHGVASSEATDPAAGDNQVDVTVNLTLVPTATTVTISPPTPAFGQPVTIAATVAPAPPATGTPTGTVAIYLDGAATPVATLSLAGGHASLTTASLGAGSHQARAVYRGDSHFASSSGQTATPAVVTCNANQIITGNRAGSIVIASGSACIIDATISGAVSVLSGAALDIENSTVNGSVTASSPAGLRMCATTTGGTVAVTGATGLVVIGDNAIGCTPNTVAGSLNLINNTGGVEAIGNNVKTVAASNNSGPGPFPGDTTTIADNKPR